MVIGHLVARDPPADAAWWMTVKAVIYSFHMPFFMFLSGYVFYMTRKDMLSGDALGDFLKKRAERLLVPFLAFGALLLIGKYTFSHFVYIDNAARGPAADLWNIFIHTDRSPVLSIWYILVLFYISTVCAAFGAQGRGWMALLPAAVVLFVIPSPEWFYVDRFCTYLVFFMLGAVAVKAPRLYEPLLDRAFLPLCAVFLASLVIATLPVHPKIPLLVCGCLSIPVLHGIALRIRGPAGALFDQLGAYSFVIYLLNTAFIGLAKGLMLKFVGWDGWRFAPFLAVLLACGLLGPILVKRYVFSRAPVLDRITS